MTHSIDMDHIKSLTIEQRLELIDEIWDSISEEDAAGLTEDVKRELDRRLADDAADPDSGFTWVEVQEHMRGR